MKNSSYNFFLDELSTFVQYQFIDFPIPYLKLDINP